MSHSPTRPKLRDFWYVTCPSNCPTLPQNSPTLKVILPYLSLWHCRHLVAQDCQQINHAVSVLFSFCGTVAQNRTCSYREKIFSRSEFLEIKSCIYTGKMCHSATRPKLRAFSHASAATNCATQSVFCATITAILLLNYLSGCRNPLHFHCAAASQRTRY